MYCERHNELLRALEGMGGGHDTCPQPQPALPHAAHASWLGIEHCSLFGIPLEPCMHYRLTFAAVDGPQRPQHPRAGALLRDQCSHHDIAICSALKVMDRSYHGENRPSHQHWARKHHWARSVVRWGTTCEPLVTICFSSLSNTPLRRPCARLSAESKQGTEGTYIVFF